MDNVDRLSALPDDFLYEILSLLPAKDAVAFLIVSTKWRKLFTSVPDTNFCVNGLNDPDDPDPCSVRSFRDEIHVGCRILALRTGAPLRKFQLHIKQYVGRFASAVELFILKALACRVRELDIHVGMTDKSRLIPPEVFTCKTLVTLKLTRDVDLDLIVPNAICLPNLKVLHLRGEMRVVDGICIQRLIKGCPSLEELNLVLCRMDESDEDQVIDFSSPSLKRFTLASFNYGGLFDFVLDSSQLEYLEFHHVGKHRFTLDAPNLSYLNYECNAVEVNLIQKNFTQSLKSVVRASIAIRYMALEIFNKTIQTNFFLDGRHAFELINDLQSVKSLQLHGHTLLREQIVLTVFSLFVKALFEFRGRLPTFRNLTILQLGPFNYDGVDHGHLWKMLPRLLESAPDLEVLILGEAFGNVFTRDREFEVFLPLCFSSFEVFLPLCLPSCCLDRLREVEIREFNNEEYEFKLVKYILKNGKSLKKMTIGGVIKAMKSSEKCCKRISSFNKSSQDCQIVFN
ncbi:F-box protein At4g22280-like [Coffea eugenioides]|uniref:F-box protein At4g22280-like n=1 Tax=Coffea eugenioides TaxID=49369 RepID=UPI000F614391|nr:F-box protein At4g22280-like [Coffea eugenioides]